MTISNKAFTLVELIVVITILAILATVGFLALQGYTKDAKDSATKTNVRTVAQAVELESAAGGASVRRFASFSGAYAMSGKVLGTVLSGGTVGTAGTNYTPGLVDFAALKLDASKFAADGSQYLMSAVDVPEKLVTGKTRNRTYFQIAALAGTSAYVEGTFSSALMPSSSTGSETTVTGIIANPASPGGAVALSSNLDAAVAGGSSSGWSSSWTPVNFFAGSGSSATPWMKGDISALASCKAYRDASATSPAGTAWSSSDGTSQDGVYSIDPDGAGGNAKFPVYCDMTNDSGGWTLVWKVGDGTSIGNANYDSASSDITSLSDVAYQNGVLAKLDDWVINALKSSIGSNDPVYRLEEDVSGSKQTDYFPGSCVFSNGGSFSQPDCRKMSTTFVTPTWIQDSYAGGTGTPGFWCASSGPWESSVFCSSIGTRSAALHLYPAYVTDNAHTTRMTRVFVR